MSFEDTLEWPCLRVRRLRDGTMALIRFLFRVAATISLAVAVIMAVIDATRSIAADRLVLTSLAENWRVLAPETLEAALASVQDSTIAFATPALEAVLAVPGAAVMMVVAFVFYMIGRRPARRVGRFVVEN
jgi:hypothetical protein